MDWRRVYLFPFFFVLGVVIFFSLRVSFVGQFCGFTGIWFFGCLGVCVGNADVFIEQMVSVAYEAGVECACGGFTFKMHLFFWWFYFQDASFLLPTLYAFFSPKCKYGARHTSPLVLIFENIPCNC